MPDPTGQESFSKVWLDHAEVSLDKVEKLALTVKAEIQIRP